MVTSASGHKKLFIAAVIAVIVITMTGCSKKSSVSTPSGTGTPSTPVPTSGNLTIYELADSTTSAHADDNGLIAVTVKVDPQSKDLAHEALDALAESKNTPLPPGTTVLSVNLDQSAGLATVNFSHEFKDKFTGGDTREAQVLNSVLETLGQFPDIQNVQFLVAGKKVDSLGGTQDLDSPLPVVKSTAEASAGA